MQSYLLNVTNTASAVFAKIMSLSGDENQTQKGTKKLLKFIFKNNPLKRKFNFTKNEIYL